MLNTTTEIQAVNWNSSVVMQQRQVITDPSRLLPLQRMNWSRDAYGALRAFQFVDRVDENDSRYYFETSLDFSF